MNNLNFKSKNVSRYNNTKSIGNNQVLINNSTNLLKLAYTTTTNSPCLEKSSQNYFIAQVLGLRLGRLDIFKQIAILGIYFRNITASQQYLADKAGITREWCCKVVKELERLQLITKVRRRLKNGRDDTCVYKLNPVLYSQRVRFMLSNIIPALAILSINLLTLNGVVANKYEYIALNAGSEKKFTLNYEYNLKRNVTFVGTTICKSTDKVQQSRRDVNGISDRNKMDKDFSLVVENFKTLQLTVRGKIELSGYSDAAIMDAQQNYKHSQGLKNPFSWFMSLCHKYTKANGERYDVTKRDQLLIKYEIPQDAPMVTLTPKTERSANVPFSGVSVKPVDYAKTDREKYEEALAKFKRGQYVGSKITDQYKLNILKAKAEYEEKRLAKEPAKEINFIEEYRKVMHNIQSGLMPDTPILPLKYVEATVKAKAVAYALDKQVDFPEGNIFHANVSTFQDYSKVTAEDKAKMAEQLNLMVAKTARPAEEAIGGRSLPGANMWPAHEDEYIEYSNEDQYGDILPWLP
jgi:DNA-binding Lrp family transcriptional regulator